MIKDRNRHNGSCPNAKNISESLLNAFQSSTIFFDKEGNVIRTNKSARKDLRADTDMVGSNIRDLIIVINNNNNILHELLSRFDDPETKQVNIPKDSLLGALNGQAIFFVTGCFTRLDCGSILLSFRNVAEEKTNEYMIKMALSSTKIFPWYYDFDRERMVIDPRYYAYTGIATGDFTMSLEEFSGRLHPEDREGMAHAFSLQLHGEHYPYPVPFRLRRGDDTYEWFEGQSTYLGQVKGMPYRIVGICMSTQAHKDIEQALLAAKNKAEQSDMLKSAFLANMSHEIRTPLNAIVGFSSLLAGGDTEPGSEEAKEYAALINRNCDHLLTLVSDILDLSRIETGAMEYKWEQHSLSELLSDIYANYSNPQSDKIVFNLLLPKRDVKITTDALRLRQIMENLIGNAFKFTAKGHIDVGYALSSDNKSVRLFVADTGRGIPADETEKIFDRFYKVDTFVQGAGLGLSICKTIAERLGGTIAVSSRSGEGSRFTLKLPIHPSEVTKNK